MQADLPYPKERKYLPVILSPAEVAQLIGGARNLYHRTMLMTLYSTGLRRAELCRLKVRNIDSQRMMLRVEQGKGGIDREVSLSKTLLRSLREYYRWMRPKTYLFPGTVDGWRADKPITEKIVWDAVRQASIRAGIKKKVTPHTLRHYTASRTMPRVKLWIFYLGLSLRFLRHSPAARLPRWMNDKKGIHFPKNDGTGPSGAFEQVSRCLFGGQFEHGYERQSIRQQILVIADFSGWI